MTSIEEVIARSRQPGGFSEHRTFTLARDRAIEKMRQFALADPHYYILELIQSAIANHATFIDITLDDSQVILSYIGGHYDKSELEQLFDFLFASNANVEQGSLRLLALGVNAWMLFEPDEIILESGDGTLQGTTRVVIGRRKGVVEVGTPERALSGTFMRATGMKRGEMKRRSALDSVGGRQLEYTAIEERCIVAPVPVIVNGEPIFGYSSQRTPQLFGYSHTVRFDEGDLYGTIGLASRKSSAVFRLVTHGAWVQTVGHDFLERVNTGYEEPLLGGVISFGPLRKTADHSGIVKDAVYDQMWQRLLPYLEQLRFGTQAQRMEDILQLDGTKASPVEVIQWIREARGVVILPVQKFVEGSAHVAHAARVGEALLFPVMVVDEAQEKFVRSVAGNEWAVVQANGDDPDELLLYQKPENILPARPWLIESIDCQTVSMDEVNAYIESSGLGELCGASAAILRARFWGGKRAIKTTLYTQFDADQSDTGDDPAWADLRVWIQVCGRLVQEVRLATFFPGQVLVVDIPDMQPARLHQSVQHGEPTMAVMIAQAVALMCTTTLDESVRQAVQGLNEMAVAPGSLGARWIVAGLANSTITRLNAEPGQAATMSIALIDRGLNPSLLDVPVLETLTGKQVSVRDLAGLIQDGSGLIYGVVPEVEADLEGLDERKILRLDMHLERLLVELLGEASYVRVDSRDVLAEYQGVQCRDIALGLRTYADFPLLVEGADVTKWPEEAQRQCIDSLVKQLRAQVEAKGAGVPQENRRQALRHLQWFAANRARFSFDLAETNIDDDALFLMNQGVSASYAVVRRAQQSAGNLRMLDGLARDIVGSAQSPRSVRQGVGASVDRIDLVMNPFVFWLLNAQGPIVGLTDHGLLGSGSEVLDGQDRSTDSKRYIDQIELKDEQFEGALMIPFREDLHALGAAAKAKGAVLVVSEDRTEVLALEDAFHAYGVVGVLKLRVPHIKRDALVQAVLSAAKSLFGRQVTRLASGALTQGETYEQVVWCLLQYAGQHVHLTMQPDGMIGARVVDLMANRILELPLFSTQHGTPVSIRRLFYAFRNTYFTNPSTDFDDLNWVRELIAVEEISEPMRAWLLEHFHPERIHRLAERRRTPGVLSEKPEKSGGQASGVMSKEQALAESIRYWLQALRPDSGFTAGVAGTEDLPMRILFGEHPQMKLHRSAKTETLLALDMPARWQVQERNPGDDSTFQGMSVWMNPNHWMIRWALESGQEESRPLAWLLLAVYAHINEVLEAVRNVDEQVFQQRIYSALRENRLKWVV